MVDGVELRMGDGQEDELDLEITFWKSVDALLHAVFGWGANGQALFEKNVLF